MPTFRKLTAEELESYRTPMSGKRAKIRTEYRNYLEQIKLGQGGELILNEGEKKVTIKNRLKRAAKEMNLKIQFKRSSPNTARFIVLPLNDEDEDEDQSTQSN